MTTESIPAHRVIGMRGRKLANESRAPEIRAKLLMWKQTPESQRTSLRALAVELGTSHQLLGVYLKGLSNWQKRDYKRRAQVIRSLAEGENRDLTPWEESQVKALERAAFRCMVESALASALRRYEAELREWTKKSSLTRSEIRFVKTLAQLGVPMAQELLKKHRINLPQGAK